MKVLQVGKYYLPTRGGIETVLAQLCRQLQGKVELEVVVASDSGEDRHDVVDGIAVHRLGTPLKLAGAPISPGLRQAMRRADADIIHIHVPHPTALLTWLVSGCRGKLVISYHSDIIRQRVLGALIGPLQDLAYRRASALLSSSPDLIAGSPALAPHRDRCVCCPFGLDVAPYEAVDAAAVAEIRKQFPGPLILAVGRLVYYKGFEFLVRAMARVPAPATALIIGEGPERKQLEEEITRLGLAGRVRLLGNIPDTTPYYQACDLFVLPSIARSEAFGLVQLEAMACGKAVVNTRIPDSGVPFVSRHEESGLTVPPADSERLAEAITRLLQDDFLRTRFGEAGRQRVHRDFSPERMARRILEVYRRALAGEPMTEDLDGLERP
jgi:rhamnosyl/mannosyltransferase